MQLRVAKISRTTAYAHCPRHEDRHPSLAITLDGAYEGRFHCYSCGWSGTLTRPFLDQLRARRSKKQRARDQRSGPIDWYQLSNQYQEWYVREEMSPPFLNQMVCDALDIGWDGEAYTIPMRDARQEIIGIQRRFPDGFKSMVESSKLGLIIPHWSFSLWYYTFVCEGASDTGAVAMCGYPAIGRASNITCEDLVVEFCGRNHLKRIIVVSDNDEPGRKGSRRMMDTARTHGIGCDVVTPPTKDIRELVEADHEEAERLLKQYAR